MRRQLFERIVFNVAIGNIDHHARNHATFWDGQELTLSPAYDLCPQFQIDAINDAKLSAATCSSVRPRTRHQLRLAPIRAVIMCDG